MENVVFTQMSVTELLQLVKQTVEQALATQATYQKPNEQAGQYLTPDEAAAFLHCSKSTIYNKCSDGLIPRYKFGKRLYFLKEDLIELVQSGKRQTIAEIQQEAASYLKQTARRNTSDKS